MHAMDKSVCKLSLSLSPQYVVIEYIFAVHSKIEMSGLESARKRARIVEDSELRDLIQQDPVLDDASMTLLGELANADGEDEYNGILATNFWYQEEQLIRAISKLCKGISRDHAARFAVIAKYFVRCLCPSRDELLHEIGRFELVIYL